jgi:hypothetical protein
MYHTDYFVPPEGYAQRREYRDAWRNWLREEHFNYFITLNFNRPTSYNGARPLFGEWLARVDSAFLGRSWTRNPRIRAFAVAFTENPHSNLHLHVLLRPPQQSALRPKVDREAVFANAWRKLVRSGSCHVQHIDDLPGVVRYVTKQLTHRDHALWFMLSREFHNT